MSLSAKKGIIYVVATAAGVLAAFVVVASVQRDGHIEITDAVVAGVLAFLCGVLVNRDWTFEQAAKVKDLIRNPNPPAPPAP